MLNLVGNGISSEQPKVPRYQCPNVDIEIVMENPEEYIIPECLPACYTLWAKNIETFMVSNYDDPNLYVLMAGLSQDNETIIKTIMEIDHRYFKDYFRECYGFKVEGQDKEAMEELESLAEVFELQDTLRFFTPEEFLTMYKKQGGEFVITESGRPDYLINPNLENATLEEALKKTGMESLYLPEENRVYQREFFLHQHNRYMSTMKKKHGHYPKLELRKDSY